MDLVPANNNNGITMINGIPMMSHLEIASLLEKRNDTVKMSMERLIDQGVISITPMTEKVTGGRPRTNYYVNQRDSYVVVAQLSPEFTARVIDRWMELEKAPSIPQTLPEALRLAADLAEENEKLALQNSKQQLYIEHIKPKAELYDTIFVPSKGDVRLSDFGRTLVVKHGKDTGPNRIFTQLRDRGIIMKGRPLPYSTYHQSGYFNIKFENSATGRVNPVAFLTPKGQTFVWDILEAN